MTAILVAYALVSCGLVRQGSTLDHVLDQALDLSGAVGIGIVCVHRRRWQAFLRNVFWGLIATSSLWRAFARARSDTRSSGRASG